MRYSTLFSSILATSVACVSANPVLTTFKDSFALTASFDGTIPAYWTGLPHHRRTPFSVSPDGKSAYLAYLDATLKTVHVQQVDTETFTAVGTPFSTPGFEAAGLVAQDDGFALLATVKAAEKTTNEDAPIVSLIRVKGGAEAWRTSLNGPGVNAAAGLTATPDANGDLVYSAASGLYAAYFVVTAYTGYAAGHFGDSIQYVDDTGARQDIPSASTFGCSHNTGIALEAADAPPFASICAEDHGAIWLNTETRSMSGVKIANENTTNGVSGEPMGGMSGSYSNLALFPGTTEYIFAWQSRGAVDLYTDSWMGAPYVQSAPRWLNHNVAIAILASKSKLAGEEASSVVGAKDGDSQVIWLTKTDTVDHDNVRVGALNATLALVTWETLENPTCEPVPMSCTGTFAGTSFQFVDDSGKKVGTETVDPEVTVSGDMAVINGKICWPYVAQPWDLSKARAKGTPTSSMSFACAGVDGAGGAAAVASPPSTASPTSSPGPSVPTESPEVANEYYALPPAKTPVPKPTTTPATFVSGNAGAARTSTKPLPTPTPSPTGIRPIYMFPNGTRSNNVTNPTPSGGYASGGSRLYPTGISKPVPEDDDDVCENEDA
ncbi:hypothetical protein HYFRA_00002890 [Hymenoscyphus fraxineus]|uniref:Uncharacterized protein n=1 Tax=Hymenoscyphus fraxineus TaxID=746836 RepID=A0A9N9KMS7_9HELO|nr:hypothetical protein HYFRA_00002890 [Hymenoscyphus fraxineus]